MSGPVTTTILTQTNGPLTPGDTGFSVFSLTGGNAGTLSATIDWTFSSDTFLVGWFQGDCVHGICSAANQLGAIVASTTKPFTISGPAVPTGGTGPYTLAYENTGLQTESVSITVKITTQ